jgi:hypothetical protein
VSVATDEQSQGVHSVLVVGSIVSLVTASVVPTEKHRTDDQAPESSRHWSSSTHGNTLKCADN